MKFDLATIGLIVIFIGIMLIFLSTLNQKGDSKFAVGGIIGFIPFGFGNDKGLVLAGIVISAILFFVFLTLNCWR